MFVIPMCSRLHASLVFNLHWMHQSVSSAYLLFIPLPIRSVASSSATIILFCCKVVHAVYHHKESE